MPKPIKILLIALVGGAALAAVIGALFAFGILGQKNMPVTASDRLILTSIEDVAPLFTDFTPIEATQRITKLRHADGSLELSLVYDPRSDGQPYLSCTLKVEASEAAARSSFHRYWSALETAPRTRVASFEDVDVSRVFRQGDEVRFANVVRGEQVVGNSFSCRMGRKIYTMQILGFHFQEPKLLHTVLRAKLKQLKHFDAS